MAPHLLPSIALRPARDEDLEFLFRVYAGTRADELAPVPWSAEEKEAFLRQQFTSQHAWWKEHYVGATFDIVMVDGTPAGRFYVDRWEREIRVVDIALLPEYRGSGVGTSLLERVFAEGDASGRPVSVHVEVHNPARSLYERLGFRLVEDKGVYLLLSRPPAVPVTAS